MKKLIFIFLVFFWLPVLETFAGEQATNPIWIGILRNDGILTPIVLYYKKQWLQTWPEQTIDEQSSTENVDIKNKSTISIKDIPIKWLGGTKEMPQKWLLWSKASKPNPIHISEVIQYESHCAGGWGLKTDFYAGSVNYSPKPKAGIATSTLVSTVLMEEIDNKSKEALRVIPLIKNEFEKLENKEIDLLNKKDQTSKNYLLYTGHPISQEERKKADFKIDNIYKSAKPIQGQQIYSVEASRKYNKTSGLSDPSCYGISYLNGLVIMTNEKASIIKASVAISDCDGKNICYIKPDVILNINGGHYLVAENYGYEWEYYTISEILNGVIEEVLRVEGGGC